MKEGFPLADFKLRLKLVTEIGANASSHLLPHSVAEVLPPFCGYHHVSPSFQRKWDAAQATQVHAEAGSKRQG